LLSSPLECPEGFDPIRYMVNIGLAQHKLSSVRGSEHSVANLNALPVPYQPKPVSLTNILALPGAIVAAGLLAFLIILTQIAVSDVASLRVDLNTTEELLQQRQAQRKELSDRVDELQKEITEIDASRDKLVAALDSIEEQNEGVNLNLSATVNNLRENMSLSSIGYTAGILTINGNIPNEDEMILYLRDLEASGKFSVITITNMKRIEDGTMDFYLILKTGE